MASIHPAGKGKWRVHYTADGKRCTSPTCDTYEDAVAWQRSHLAAQSSLSLFDLIEAWRADRPTPHRTDAARRLAAVAVKRCWGDALRLTRADLELWAKEDPAHRQPAQYLHTVLQWTHDQRGGIRPDVLAWRPARARRKPQVPLMSDSMVEAVRDCALTYGDRAFAVVDYLATYGARPITACTLPLRDLDLARGELVIENAKHSGGWRHALREAHLEHWPTLAWDGATDDDPIFPHYKEDRAWRIERGRAGEITTWYKNTIAKQLRLGVHAGIYHLKRYAITRWFRLGVDPATICSFTGQEIHSLMIYARSNLDLQQGALSVWERSANTVTNSVTKLQDSKS